MIPQKQHGVGGHSLDAQPPAPQTERLAAAPNTPTLPSLWTIPDARRDKESRLGVLLRNILYLDGLGGCHASNAFFASHPTLGLGKNVSTVRRGLADLEACGLIVREFDEKGQRTIRPLVTAVELIEAGWTSLAEAILGMKKWPAVIRAMCRTLLKRVGKWRRELDLGRLGVRSERQNCAGSARAVARPFPVKERKTPKTTTDCVVVSETEAETLARSAGLAPDAARSATSGKSPGTVQVALSAARAYATRHEVRSFPALLFTAIRSEWLPPAPPPRHFVRAVKALRPIRALGDARPSEQEIRNMARLLWKRSGR